MDYKYNAVNELNHFDFAEAVVGDIQLLGKMFHIVIDNVKILPENSFNRDIRTMRTNGMLFKIEGAEIISVVEEGFNTYTLVDGTIFEVKLENGVYAFVIDGNNERTYELKVAGSGDYESWNLFINL